MRNFQSVCPALAISDIVSYIQLKRHGHFRKHTDGLINTYTLCYPNMAQKEREDGADNSITKKNIAIHINRASSLSPAEIRNATGEKLLERKLVTASQPHDDKDDFVIGICTN